MKIFLLPKFATQSPRNAYLSHFDDRDDICAMPIVECVN